MGPAREPSQGCIEVICGCMFSGKTGLLIDRVVAARAAGRTVAVFKHSRDARYERCSLVSHDGRRVDATPTVLPEAVEQEAGDADLVAVDEVQFFDERILDVCRRLRERGKRVVLAGLDRDSWSEPFGVTPELVAMADDVHRMATLCAVCGGLAEFTQRKTPVAGDMVGGPQDYEPRCGKCFSPPPADLRR